MYITHFSSTNKLPDERTTGSGGLSYGQSNSINLPRIYNSICRIVEKKLNPIVEIFGQRILAFQLYGLYGLVAITALSAVLSITLDLSLGFMCLVISIQVGLFWFNGFLCKRFLGKEKYVLYRQALLAILTTILLTQVFHYPLLPYLNICAINTIFFVAIGRIGCLKAGCCYGTPCLHGIRYRPSYAKDHFPRLYTNNNLIPVQLIESVLLLLLTIFGLVQLLTYPESGVVYSSLAIIYAVARFYLEFWRGDGSRFHWQGLSEAQWTSVGIVILIMVIEIGGLLALNYWHIGIAIMFLLSFFLVLKNRINLLIFNASHLKEIARFINPIAENCDPELTTLKTSQGLNLSKNVVINNFRKTCCYAISSSTLELDNRSRHKLVRHVTSLHRGDYDQQDCFDSNGITYILLSADYDSKQTSAQQFSNGLLSKLYCGT